MIKIKAKTKSIDAKIKRKNKHCPRMTEKTKEINSK